MMILRQAYRSRSNRRMFLETLDARTPFAADLATTFSPKTILGTSPAISGPVAQPSATNSNSSPMALTTPISNVFQFSSYPNAAHVLYLDFNGFTQATWGAYHPNTTPAYDIDGNLNTFNDQEQKNIESIVRQVAEDYSPFNVNVTTIEPAGSSFMRLVIGGTGGWLGQVAGGVAYVDSYSTSNKVAYVFSDNLLDIPKSVGEAVSHEAGHSFGLYHQSTWFNGQITQEYNPGTADLAPIMGNSYSSRRGVWWSGMNGEGQWQNDVTVLTSRLGARPDDFSLNATVPLNQTGNRINDRPGIIENVNDIDRFTLFVTSTGVRKFALNVPAHMNLLPVLQLKNGNGAVLATATASPSNNGSIWLTYNFTSTGTYYMEVSSASTSQGATSPGDIGQYTLTERQDGDYMIGLAGAGWWGTSLNTGVTKLLSTWSTAVTWNNPITGDFNGDGATDFAAQANGVQWWYGLSGAGNSYTIAPGTTWSAGTKLIGARDVNGDHRDDIVGFTTGNHIVTALSTAGTPINSSSNPWSTAVTWGDQVLGDFNGDGLSDFAARVQNDGNWWVMLGSTSTALAGVPAHWGNFGVGTYREMTVADINGDGRDDVLGRMSNSNWFVGIATDINFFNVRSGVIPGTGTWSEIRSGDLFRASSVSVADEIIGRDSLGNWQKLDLTFSGSTLSGVPTTIGSWGADQYANTMIRDVDRDGVFELIGRQTTGSQAGTWRIDRMNGNSLVRDTRAIRNPAWANIPWYADLAYDDGDIF